MAEYVYGERLIDVSRDGTSQWTEKRVVTERRERVVRCRDCAHAITSYPDGLPRCAGPLVMEATLVSPDCFCAWGEPRDGSET